MPSDFVRFVEADDLHLAGFAGGGYAMDDGRAVIAPQADEAGHVGIFHQGVLDIFLRAHTIGLIGADIDNFDLAALEFLLDSGKALFGILRIEGDAFGPWFDSMARGWIARNGMLPIVLSEAQVDDLFHRAAKYKPYELTADLNTCTLTDKQGLSLKFEVEGFRRHCLLNGLDDIGLTLEHEDKISQYERTHAIA